MTDSPAARMVIGVCTFNRGPSITRTLEAIAAMDRAGGRVTRLIVIDNNSTDDTAHHVDRFATNQAMLPTTRIIEPRQGQGFARHRLVTETDEEIIAFLDDDVVPEVGWASAVLCAFDERPAAAMVGGIVELEYQNGPTPHALRDAALLARQHLGSAARRVDAPMTSLVGAACGLRRAALVGCGWLEHRLMGGRAGGELTSGDDYELGIRLRRAGGELWYTPKARCLHLIPPQRQTRAYLDKLLRGVSRAEAFLNWIEVGEPDVEWVERGRARALAKLTRTRWLDWRPHRRARRLLERSARLDGWNDLLQHVRARGGD
ncbi:MAG: glycosyltransferase [Phycisphaerales bacterium]|nr:glycosyltransferase [Phycisphaerales bacterium]